MRIMKRGLRLILVERAVVLVAAGRLRAVKGRADGQRPTK